MSNLRVVDNDVDTVSVTDDGKHVRSWSYASETERRTKMLLAREFVEGAFYAYEAQGREILSRALPNPH